MGSLLWITYTKGNCFMDYFFLIFMFIIIPIVFFKMILDNIGVILLIAGIVIALIALLVWWSNSY